MTKAPSPTEMTKGQSDNTNNATKKLDYTVIADRLRTVSWINYSYPTGVVNLVYEPTFQLTASAVYSRVRTGKYYSTVTLKLYTYNF